MPDEHPLLRKMRARQADLLDEKGTSVEEKPEPSYDYTAKLPREWGAEVKTYAGGWLVKVTVDGFKFWCDPFALRWFLEQPAEEVRFQDLPGDEFHPGQGLLAQAWKHYMGPAYLLPEDCDDSNGRVKPIEDGLYLYYNREEGYSLLGWPYQFNLDALRSIDG